MLIKQTITNKDYSKFNIMLVKNIVFLGYRSIKRDDFQMMVDDPIPVAYLLLAMFI